MKAKCKPKVITQDEAIETSPIGFIETFLGLSLYPWQDKAVAPLELAVGPNWKRTKIATLAPNGAGKDERIVAPSALYWAWMFKRGKVVIISKDSKQINEQTVPQLQRHIHKFEGWKSVNSPYYKVTTPSGGSIHCFVTDEASRLEGWHKEDDTDGPLLFIINEAKSVIPPHYQAVYRCGWNCLMLVSSGGLMMGDFFDAFNRNKEDFITVQAGLKDCPHIPDAKVQDIIKTYGERHPFTRSSVYGEFMEQDEADQFVIPHSALQFALQNPPRFRPGIKAGFWDFAEGTAEHVLAVRNGNKVEIACAFREANKHAAVSRVIHETKKAGLEPRQTWGDAADKELLDLLAELGFPINRQNFGHKANEEDVFISWGAEAWHNAGSAILKGEVIVPEDAKLHAQLTTRKKTIKGMGKMGVEEKYVMLRDRNLPSPDRGDAFCGVINIRDIGLVYKEAFYPPSGWVDDMELAPQREVLESVGAFAGN